MALFGPRAPRRPKMKPGLTAFDAAAGAVGRYQDEIQWHYVGPDRQTVHLKRTGAWMRVFEVRGPNLHYADAGERFEYAMAANRAFRTFADRRWAVYFREERWPVREHPDAACGNPAARLIDEERARQFRSGALHENRQYIAVVFQPSKAVLAGVERILRGGRGAAAAEDAYARDWDAFTGGIGAALGGLPWLSETPCFVRPVRGDALATFLRRCAVLEDRPVALPAWPVDLPHLLIDQPFVGGANPRIGCDGRAADGTLLAAGVKHVRAVTVRGFPVWVDAGILDGLAALPFPLIRSTRWFPKSQQEAMAELKQAWDTYCQGRKTLKDQAFAALSRSYADTDHRDYAAVSLAEDAVAAQQETASDDALARWGKITTRVLVWDGDEAVAAERAKAVVDLFQTRGFTACIESINAAEAVIGTIPGQVWHDIDQPSVTTAALATVVPVAGIWSGPERCAHLNTPPLIYAATAGTHIRRVDLHDDAVGHAHTAIVGATGSGKSFLENLLLMQHFARVPDGRAISWDRKYGTLVPGLCFGASVYDPSVDGPVQPLRHIDEPAFLGLPSGLDWATQWVMDIIAEKNPDLPRDPAVARSVRAALEVMAQIPNPDERTMRKLFVVVQHAAVKEILHAYAGRQQFAGYFDGVADRSIGAGVRWQIYQLDALFGLKGAIGPMMAYLCREADRMKRHAAGAHVKEHFAELWMLDGPFQAMIEARARLARTYNVGLIFSTQSVIDLESRAGIIEESCANRIYTAGRHVASDRARELLLRLGLRPGHIEALKAGTPKRDYLIHRRDDTALVNFWVPPESVTAAICTTSQDAVVRAQAMLREDPAIRPRFLAHWLRERGLGGGLREGGLDDAVAA